MSKMLTKCICGSQVPASPLSSSEQAGYISVPRTCGIDDGLSAVTGQLLGGVLSPCDFYSVDRLETSRV